MIRIDSIIFTMGNERVRLDFLKVVQGITADQLIKWVHEMPDDRNLSWFIDFALQHMTVQPEQVNQPEKVTIDYARMGLMTLADFCVMPKRRFPHPWNDLAFAVHTVRDPDASEAFYAFIDLITRNGSYHPLKGKPSLTVQTHPLIGFTLGKDCCLEPQIRHYSVDDWVTWSTKQPLVFPLVNLPVKIHGT